MCSYSLGRYIPVIKTADMTAGSFIMAARDAMRLVMSQEAAVEMFPEDGTNVQQNLVTIRAELRAALAVLVPAAVFYAPLTA
ncbi:MAG: hypothetical protein AAGA95_02335 [Pseudomonadota bacterium]